LAKRGMERIPLVVMDKVVLSGDRINCEKQPDNP
jgi:hypothetical protein